MSSTSVQPRFSFKAMFLVAMFLFADMMVPSLYPATFPDSPESSHSPSNAVTWNYTSSIDTYIDSGMPSSTYGSDTTALIGIDGASEARMLIEFTFNLSTAYTVYSATLNLECFNDDGDVSEFYIANLTSGFNESNANWMISNTSQSWNLPLGAESGKDRSAWEPSVSMLSNGTVSLNVTRQVQYRAANNWTSGRYLISATGSQSECYTSDNSNSTLHPSLSVVLSNTNASSVGSLSPNWIDDGVSLMTSDFILTADTTPTLSWGDWVGDNVEIQLSESSEFRRDGDGGGHWTSMANSSMFSLTGGSSCVCTMAIGSNEALSNGTTMYYRMRSINNYQIGDWVEGWFNLPGHDITDNGDGTATISIDADGLGLSEKTIWDAELDSSQKSTSLGSEASMVVGTDTSPDKESTALMKFHLQHLGMHTNVTIKSAEMILTRDSVNGSELVSMIFVENHVDWSEEDATWNSPLGDSTDWDVEVGTVLDSISMDASNDEFSFNTTLWTQAYLDLGMGDPIDIIISGQDADGSFSSSNDITFHSTEASTSSDQPRFEVTYEWGSSSPVSPVDIQYPTGGQGIWEIDDHNLSGNTTPELRWDGSAFSGNEVLFQLSDDKLFRNILKEVDTSVDNDFQPSDGSYNITSSFGLSTGAMYYWRMAQVDPADGRWSFWNEESFFITELNSTYLGDNKYQLTLRDGNASSNGGHPSCQDTYIDSGTTDSNYDSEQEMQVAYNTYGSGAETSILFGCHLLTHHLPDGYAVVEAKLRFKMAYAGGNPYIGAYESHQHNWTEDRATWNEYDGRNSWGTVGAKGWERGQLLSSTTISGSSNSWFEWNVTLGVQNAMRNGENFDVILSILGAGSGLDREALLYGNQNVNTSRPELIFTYVPGSSALPDEPVPLSPANGSWSVADGIERSTIRNPLLHWNYSGSTNVSGFVVDIDSNTSFESADLLSYGSWSSSGFDVNNMTFQMPVNLAVAKTWFWRVRAISTTNQIGNWSQYNHFHVPDLTTWSIDNDTAAVELHHREAMPSLNAPNFMDTWISNTGANVNDSNPNDDYLYSGEMTDGSLATSLMKIPLTDIPMPQNATLKQANLNLYCEWGSSSSQRISIHTVNGTWNDSATGLTRDGVNNWSASSTLSAEDVRDDEFFIVQNVTVSSWMEFDITDLAQKAHAGGATHIEFAIVADDDLGMVKLSSSESATNPPWLNLTWTTGAQAAAEVAATGGAPNGKVLWDNSTVALYPAGTPTLSWNHSNSSTIDAWRLFFLHDSLDSRVGWNTFDSRSDSGFNISNLSYTPPSNLSNGKCYIWYVQPVGDDVFGEYSNRYSFCLPKWIGEALNSTDAYANIRDGGFLPQEDLPDYFKDSWLDQTYVNNNHGSNSSLVIGTSPHNVNNAATTVLMYNLTGMEIKTPFEVVGATLSLYKTGGLSNTQNISVSVLYDGFEENNVTWNERVNGVTWNSGGGLSSLDAGLPIDMVEVLDDGRYTWDITHAAQLGHQYGYQTAWFIFRTEDSRAPWHEFASSEHSNVDYRPELNLTWRTGNGWTPSDIGGQNPSNGETVWGISSERPTHPNPLVLEWNSTDTNVSEWQIQYSTNNRFIGDSVNNCSSLTCASNSNGAPFFDFANQSFSIPVNSSLTIDDWTYWRVRSLQGNRIGNWTGANSFRVPSLQGTDDGTGNYSVTLHRDSVFRYSGSLPTVPDTWIDSSSTSTNHGSSTNLTLGMSHGGNGDSRILIEFDLDELTFPSNMIPTQALLKLYRYQVVGVTPVTISAHACDSFSQSAVSFSSAPTCNSTEITRSTLGIFPPQAWVEWDITSLAQSNILSGNRTLTVMLAATSTPSTTTIFRSSEYSNLSLRPKLVFDYVDNVNGSVPPAQPTLLSPSDGQVVYDADNWTLTPGRSPMFEWNPVSDATGYILTISNDTGRSKYRSWEDNGFNGSTYTLSSNLEVGESYDWWVQALNGSIPGPSSSRWSFAVGNPVNNSYNGDLTWTYELRHGQEVPQFAHPDIGDGWIGNHSISTSHPNGDILVGEGCGNGAGILSVHECRGMFTIDISDIPLPTDSNAHSASISFIVSNINVLNGGMGMTLSVHPLLTLPFNSQASNWNASSAGNMWSTPGLQPGIDYGPALDTISISMMSMGQEIWLDLTYPGLDLSTANHFILIGTTVGIGQMYTELHSSEAFDEQLRPLILFNYTNADSVVINPGTGISTDADTNVSFTHTLYDSVGGLLSQSVEWSAENGTIDSNGLFIPHTVGTWGISACFGAICDIIQITVNPGDAVSHSVWSPGILQITTDQSLDLMASVVDQHGNLVSGEVLAWSLTNGTLSTISAPSQYNEAYTFNPYNAGFQTVTVSWNNIDIDVVITVNTGAPSYFDISPCSSSINAGGDCQFTYILRDAKENLLDIVDAGVLSWEVEDGNITPSGLYTGDKVGTWFVNLSSASGASASSSITVGYGAIDHLRIDVSNNTITADEVVWMNTTRVDIRGNELLVELPYSAWSMQNGTIVNGTPAMWIPYEVGNKWIRATLEGVTEEIHINIEHGVMIAMEIERTQGLNVVMVGDEMTTDEDDRVTLRAWGNDANGNRWTIDATWSLSVSQSFAQYCDENKVAPTCYFEADLVMPTPYEMRATYAPDDSTEFFTTLIYFDVSHGVLDSMEFDSDGGLDIETTVDDKIQFSVILRDSDDNEISPESVEFELSGTSLLEGDWTVSLSQAMWDNELEWTSGLVAEYHDFRSDVVGDYILKASIGELEEVAHISILHGNPVSFETVDDKGNIVSGSYSIIAGETFQVFIIAFDSAGNQFSQEVEWSGQQQGTSTWTYSDIGQVVALGGAKYAISLTKSTSETGPHILRYSHALVNDESDVINVTVYPANIGRLELVVGAETVQQLDSLDITITAFDIHDNEILVPSSIQVSASGRGTVSMVGGDFAHWRIVTLDEGKHTVTIAANNNSGFTLSQTGTYTVEGNLAGFFESGGTIYYVGAGLGFFVLAALVVVVVVLMRRSGEGYGEYDDDYDDGVEYDSPDSSAGPTSGPESGPTDGPQISPQDSQAAEYSAGEYQQEGYDQGGYQQDGTEQQSTGDDNYRVDENGTEWWQDDNGVWWYKAAGDPDWSEWRD